MTLDHHCQQCEADTPDALCRRCVRLVELRLADLPALVDDLEVTITRQARGGTGGHHKRGDEQPLPYNAAASDKRVLLAVLAEWADHVAADTGVAALPLTPTVDDHRNRTRAAVAILLANIGWFRVSDQAGEAADAIWHIRDTIQRAVDRPPVRWYAGPCGHVTDGQVCTRDLYAKHGQPVVICDGHREGDGGCGARHAATDRAAFQLAALEDALLPLDAILAALPGLIGRNPDRATVRQWRKRGSLQPRGLTVLGVETYRGGDVIALARENTGRPGPKRRAKAASA